MRGACPPSRLTRRTAREAESERLSMPLPCTRLVTSIVVQAPARPTTPPTARPSARGAFAYATPLSVHLFPATRAATVAPRPERAKTSRSAPETKPRTSCRRKRSNARERAPGPTSRSLAAPKFCCGRPADTLASAIAVNRCTPGADADRTAELPPTPTTSASTKMRPRRPIENRVAAEKTSYYR